MRRFAVLGCLIVAVGCAPGEDQATPEAEMPEATAAAPVPRRFRRYLVHAGHDRDGGQRVGHL